MQITPSSAAVDSSGLARVDALARRAVGESPEAAGKKFEALFATLLVKEMRKALPDGFFGEGSAGDIYSGWLDQHLGESIAKRGTLHIAPIVEASLSRKQAEGAL